MADLSPQLVLEAVDYRSGGRTVLDGLSARFPGRGISAVIGPNGAGKSVTLRLIDGLLAPAGGEIRFGNRPLSAVRRAFVFQRPALVRASVAYNVGLALDGAAGDRAARRARVLAALERVGLADRAEDAARRLSGGEQQRLALARALITEPELLLLDEPTANLDPGSTAQIEGLVAAIAAAGTKVVLVSHNLGQVARLAADVLVLDRGRAVEHGPTRATLSAPQTPEARA